MQVYLYLKQIKIYHGSSNLVIVWIEFYFPEEIMDIVLRWTDSLWQKDMKMVHKILRKKKKNQDWIKWDGYCCVTFLHKQLGFAPLATWKRICQGAEGQIAFYRLENTEFPPFVVQNCMENTSKKRPRNIQMSSSVGGETLHNLQRSFWAKMLQILRNGHYKRELP